LNNIWIPEVNTETISQSPFNNYMLIIYLENEGGVDKYDRSKIGLLTCKTSKSIT